MNISSPLAPGHLYSFRFFESNVPAMMHRLHNLLNAVTKTTREVTTLVREREREIYPGIREREARWEIHHFSGVHKVYVRVTKVFLPHFISSC